MVRNARVHHAARRRGRVAARGAGAACRLLPHVVTELHALRRLQREREPERILVNASIVETLPAKLPRV